jgi:hypothetical protein
VSTLDGRAVDLDACRDMGVSMFAGEAEGRLMLRDATAGRPVPLYDFTGGLPDMERTPVPFLPKADTWVELELRCRPRLPLSGLVLHHY